MSSQNPVYSPLSLGETNISQQKHPSKKSTALALVGTLVIFSTVSLAIFGGFSNDDSDDNFGIAHVPYHKTLTTQNESIQLGNRFKNRYFEFKYEIVRGNYSHTNEDELAVKPFIVRNIERHSDGEPYDVYLHKIKPDEEGMIYWKFNLKATDKVVKTLVIRMIGINQTLNEGGKAEACLETFENCLEAPANQDLTIDMPRADTLFLGVKLYKNIKVFRYAEECMGCEELESGFSVKAYWVSTQDHLLNISSTFHDDSGRVFALSPKTGENYAKFTYNFLNNSYSHNEPDGSPVRLFDFNGLERVEDYTENTVFLRRKNPKEKGNIKWALDLNIDGLSVETVVIKIIGIDEIDNGGGTAIACGHDLTSIVNPRCGNIPFNGKITFFNNAFHRLYLNITLDEDIQIFKTKLDDEGSLENVSVEVYWSDWRDDVPFHWTLKTQNESIQLGNRFKNRYFEFKYEIERGKYSHTNEDESAVKPFLVKNIERHADDDTYDVYLQKIKPDEEGMIYWKFDLKATDKVVKTLVIRMIGINQTLNGGGKAEACLETFENCTEIPVDEDLIIDMPRADTLFLGVKLYKNIKIFRKAERCVRCSGLLSGFSVKAYWVSTQDHLLNISSTFHDDSGRVFALSPKTGENYAKFTYNFINNLYSHTEPDGSPVRLFDFNGLERVEDYTENTVFLRRKNPKEKGNIRWALNLRIDGKYVEKVVIGIIGIEEIANRGGTARACWNVLYNCIDIPIDGTFTLQNNVVDLSLDIELDEDIQIFRTKLDDEGSLENVSVEVYWRGQRENN